MWMITSIGTAPDLIRRDFLPIFVGVKRLSGRETPGADVFYLGDHLVAVPGQAQELGFDIRGVEAFGRRSRSLLRRFA